VILWVVNRVDVTSTVWCRRRQSVEIQVGFRDGGAAPPPAALSIIRPQQQSAPISQ
jgi:hypothetical protein